jgi:hypothetical protein
VPAAPLPCVSSQTTSPDVVQAGVLAVAALVNATTDASAAMQAVAATTSSRLDLGVDGYVRATPGTRQ